MSFLVVDLNYNGPNYPIVTQNDVSHLYNNYYKRLMFIASQLWLLKIAFMYYVPLLGSEGMT